MDIIDFILSISNIHDISFGLSVLLSGYLVILVSNYLLRKNKKPPHLSNKIAKWDLFFWFVVYGVLCNAIVTIIEKTLGFDVGIILKIIMIYPLAIFAIGTLDYLWSSNRHSNKTQYYTILQEIEERYKLKETFIWVNLKNGISYNGLLLGVDTSEIEKKFIKLGSSTWSDQNVPIIRKKNNKEKDLESKTVIISLEDVQTLYLNK